MGRAGEAVFCEDDTVLHVPDEEDYLGLAVRHAGEEDVRGGECEDGDFGAVWGGVTRGRDEGEIV